MGRVTFPKGLQSKFINILLEENKINSSMLASICNVSERTIRNWKREKFTLSEKALFQIQKNFKISPPKGTKNVSDYWYAQKGALKGGLKRLALYGPPGTPEGRRKGGKISQFRRKLNPEQYLNCNNIIDYKFPERSEELAELVGIILGDGGISTYQIKITLNVNKEEEYIEFVVSLMKRLFGKDPHQYAHKGDIVCNVTLNGVKLIDFLHRLGLKKGSKVKQQVKVPEWIQKSRERRVSCLRGLMDTDGGIFYHKHNQQLI